MLFRINQEARLPVGAVFVRDLVEAHRNDPSRAAALKRAKERVDAALGNASAGRGPQVRFESPQFDVVCVAA